MNSCNTSLKQSSFFSNLKKAFRESSAEYSLKFTLDEDGNIGTLTILYKIASTGPSFVQVFETTLIRSFKSDPHDEILTKIAQVSAVKDVTFIQALIQRQQKEIESFSQLSQQVKETREEVSKMREETGPLLAGKFMCLLNELKEKHLVEAKSRESLLLEAEIDSALHTRKKLTN
jgi:hypothetical protein